MPNWIFSRNMVGGGKNEFNNETVTVDNAAEVMITHPLVYSDGAVELACEVDISKAKGIYITATTACNIALNSNPSSDNIVVGAGQTILWTITDGADFNPIPANITDNIFVSKDLSTGDDGILKFYVISDAAV